MKITGKTTKKNNTFLHFNPNPTAKYKKNGSPFRWTKPDCVIRAFCAATGYDWTKSYDILSAIGRKNFDVPNSRETLSEALMNEGFVWNPICPKRGEKRPTVQEIADSSIGKTRVLNISHHEVCAKDGCFYDTWNCGEYAVYGYWEK